MKNKICLNSNTYHGFTLEEAIHGARNAGVKFIELAAVRGYTEHAKHEFTDAEVADVLQLLEDNDITLLGMCGHTNIMTEDGREHFKKNLGLAARLGAEYMVTGTGETHNDDSVVDESELVEVLRELSSTAADLGLRLAIETHGANYGTGESIVALIEKVGASNLHLNYDTGNVIIYGGVEPYEDLEGSADSIVGIHLKDKTGQPTEWNFPAIGRGDIDFPRVFSILKEKDCTSPLSIEVEFTPAGPKDVNEVHESLAYSVNTVRNLIGS
jgi:sugar phosphate isomerase/epimerase